MGWLAGVLVAAVVAGCSFPGLFEVVGQAVVALSFLFSLAYLGRLFSSTAEVEPL